MKRLVLAAIPLLLVAGSAAANAGTPPPVPCDVNLVSFYYSDGSHDRPGEFSFDITLLAHDGVACTLSDTPQIVVGDSAGKTDTIPVRVQGRGGTLVLRPDSPLHANVQYLSPVDDPGVTARTLRLSMPDKSERVAFFEVNSGVTVDAKFGVFVTSWTTGIGRGLGEGDL